MKSKQELANLIAENLSYSTAVLSPGIKCPHCGGMAVEERKCFFISHLIGTLSSIISESLDLSPHIAAKLATMSVFIEVFGDPEIDSKAIVDKIFERMEMDKDSEGKR